MNKNKKMMRAPCLDPLAGSRLCIGKRQIVRPYLVSHVVLDVIDLVRGGRGLCLDLDPDLARLDRRVPLGLLHQPRHHELARDQVGSLLHQLALTAITSSVCLSTALENEDLKGSDLCSATWCIGS